MAVLLVPILLGCCVYWALPKVSEEQVLTPRMPEYFATVDHFAIFEKLSEMKLSGDPAATLAAYRKEVQSIIAGAREKHGEHSCKNPFTGQAVLEEDSSGNYVIELKDGKPMYSYFDAYGRKIELGEIGKKVGSKSGER